MVGNPAHDLVRLALSLATAARGSDLPGVTVVKMMEQMIDGYEKALTAPRAATKADGDDLAPIRVVLQQSRRRRWHHLAEERIEDVKPRIPLGKRFWALETKERASIEKLFQDTAVIAKIMEFKGRKPETEISVVDAAYWMKGCSSLGRLRYAVLLGIGKKKRSKLLPPRSEGGSIGGRPSKQDDPPKQCRKSCNRGVSAFTQPRRADVGCQTERQGPRYAGAHAARPQIDLDRLTQDQAVAAARYLAGVIGKAHGRQMDAKTRSSWLAKLRKRHSKSLMRRVGCGRA